MSVSLAEHVSERCVSVSLAEHVSERCEAADLRQGRETVGAGADGGRGVDGGAQDARDGRAAFGAEGALACRLLRREKVRARVRARARTVGGTGVAPKR